VHAPTKDKSNDTKDNFYEELECTCSQFPKYHLKILLDFSASVGREDMFKPTIRNKSIHEISNDNQIQTVTQKI
jgi:hypothetical protein